ncbi:hypothetical protein LTR08_008088 [Meristemomyces frigidus]|nr:hypothetical protein LTR08_008088 [Meristemomyces frigidus]
MAPRLTSLKRVFSSAFQQVRHNSAPADRKWPEAKNKYVPTSGTYPKGFLVGTSHAGVKASNTTKDDIAMVVSEEPCAASAVFTKNIFQAAPVHTSKQVLTKRHYDGIRGVIINSGCANAVTGSLGLEHASTMSRETDKCFGDVQPESQTLVMSTGVIGQRLPIDKITAAIPKAHAALGATHDHWLAAAQAICTTDTFPKLISRTFTLPSHPETTYAIAGMTKGAGMIHPNMATLLGVICTDVKVAPLALKALVRRANSGTFNSITIDGDTSTNDTVAVFANGAAAPEETPALALPAINFSLEPSVEHQILRIRDCSPDTLAFIKVLTTFMEDLAKLVVRDGEGATKFVTVRVQTDNKYLTAKRVAMSIACSSLVKTALYGKDANWGRILCAIGYAPGIMHSVDFPMFTRAGDPVVYDQVDPKRTSVFFIPSDGSAELKLLVRGEPEAVDEARAKEILEMEDLEILVRLDDGPVAKQDDKPRQNRKRKMIEACVWTCDLSHEYVTINGDYRT